jgi:hypothetical protein
LFFLRKRFVVRHLQIHGGYARGSLRALRKNLLRIRFSLNCMGPAPTRFAKPGPRQAAPKAFGAGQRHKSASRRRFLGANRLPQGNDPTETAETQLISAFAGQWRGWTEQCHQPACVETPGQTMSSAPRVSKREPHSRRKSARHKTSSGGKSGPVNFEVSLGQKNDVWVMRAAGVDMRAYQQLFHQVLGAKAKLPAVVNCPYFLSDEPVNVEITVLEFGHLKIEVADSAIGKKIHAEILRFDEQSRANACGNRGPGSLYARINKILEPDGVTSSDVEADKVTLSRRAQEEFMRLCEEVHFTDRHSIYWKFTKCEIPRADRAFVAHWLVNRFAVERDPFLRDGISTVFLNHSELALRELAGDLIRLIKDARYGTSRSGLLHVLAKTRHPQAAEVIAAVMDEDQLAWSALRNLGNLKAKQYAEQIKKYLRDSDSEVRQEAKRALKKIGYPIPTPPPPVHLVRNRKLLPKGLEEWSANLDFENLEPVLKTLAGCVDEGFGAREVAEVVGVAEDTREEQTRALRFPVTAQGQRSELWLVIFMDDIDSPDLEIHAAPEVIRKFEASVDLKE